MREDPDRVRAVQAWVSRVRIFRWFIVVVVIVVVLYMESAQEVDGCSAPGLGAYAGDIYLVSQARITRIY